MEIGISLSISIGGTILIFAVISWVVGATVSNETDQIEDAIPVMTDQVRKFLDQSEVLMLIILVQQIYIKPLNEKHKG